MFLNYLKIAWRNIKRHKGYSFLNIFGLAAGMSCCILILYWVRDEKAIDAFQLYRPNYLDTWFNLAFRTYVEMQKGFDLKAFNARIFDRVRQSDPKTTGEPYLYPFARLYLDAWERGRQVRTFALIGLGILIIACINFMNLTTARSARRAREVVLRKVVGAGRAQVMKQFFGESVTMTLLALAGAGLLVGLSLPAF